jgi:shikimate dehydrogenase
MLTGATRLVGIVGNPVTHSLSPRMQNAAFAAVGLDWAYVPVPVDPSRIEEAVRGLAALGFAGANVTIPHKTAVLEHCDAVDDVARRAASVNTLVIEDGKVFGSSTDGLAVSSVADARGAEVLLVGAGGAAQAVACALVESGAASVAVAARRAEGAQRLVAHLRATFAGVEARTAAWPPDASAAKLLVNATPVKDELVVTPRAHHDVVDLAYLPDGRATALVAAARAAGCERIVDGLEVLVRQGAASFERWTGVTAPIDVMRDAVAQALPNGPPVR